MTRPRHRTGPFFGISIRSGCRTKAVVDAELCGGDRLFDIDPWHYFRNTEYGPGERHAARAEVVEIVLYFCRPILRESPLDATADGPAGPRFVGLDMLDEDWYVCRILVASPRRATLCID